MSEFIPTAYVKTNCPFSFKFRLFITEAGLAAHVRYVALDPNAPSHKRDKADLASKIGRDHTFPVVEVEPNNYLTDSDDLISHFANLNGIDPVTLPTLQFYRTGLFPTFLEMFHILATPLGWIVRLGRNPTAFR
jgi:glutathione S-transferase